MLSRIFQRITWNMEMKKYWEDRYRTASNKKTCRLAIAGHKKAIKRLLNEMEKLNNKQ